MKIEKTSYRYIFLLQVLSNFLTCDLQTLENDIAQSE